MPGTFFRLLLRPIMLFLLFLIFWAIIGPALVIGTEHGDRVQEAFRSGAPSIALLHYALILGITLPAAFGLSAATASLELQFTRMAWMLPALPRRLTAGILVFALPALAVAGWLTARASGPALGIAAFSLGVAWFAAFLHVPDAAENLATRLLLGGAFVGCMLRPDIYVAAVTAQPAVLAGAGLMVAVVLIRRHTSASVRRRRMDVASSFQSGTIRLQQYWQRAGGHDRRWNTTMTDASPVAWVRAAAHETTGIVRYGWIGIVVPHLAIGALAYLFSPGLILYLCFSIAFSGIQLRAGVLYPLSRRQRANALFMGNLLDVILLAGIAGVGSAALAAFDVPRFRGGVASPSFELAMILALMFVIAPIAQWARVRGPLAMDAAKQLGRHVVYPVGAWAATVFTMAVFLDDAASIPVGSRFWIIAALVVVAQTLHFIGIRWFYTRRDLA